MSYEEIVIAERESLRVRLAAAEEEIRQLKLLIDMQIRRQVRDTLPLSSCF